MLTLPGDPTYPRHRRLGHPRGHALPAAGWTMAASAGVTHMVDQLIDLFNRRSLDLPDGLFTRHTQFVLNGVPFEEMLGRSPADPLVLMLARGAGRLSLRRQSRSACRARRAIQRGELTRASTEPAVSSRGQCWLSGHLRGTQPVGRTSDRCSRCGSKAQRSCRRQRPSTSRPSRPSRKPGSGA